MDKSAAKMLHEEIDAALKAIAEKHEMSLSRSRASYGDGLLRVNAELAASGKSSLEKDFAQLAPAYGLRANMLNSTIMVRGQSYRIVGLNTRSSKYPVIVEDADGNQLKVPAATVARLAG